MTNLEKTEIDKDKEQIKGFAIGIVFTLAMALSLYTYWPIKTEPVKKQLTVGSVIGRLKSCEINNDGLTDLKYRNEIFLQTKEGKFISYGGAVRQEYQKMNNLKSEYKAKLDSIYQVKQDSLKRVFESKLEKEVLEE
jgi:hypothetical protein